ncbi:MAG: hypothetical protein JST10_07125 [Bacteroidetes bacterium]|nr:hypothetical protein [Bacteroidota bacterium]MBS1632330.1 hypothetical protein [Bacteroidota bacterium]
MKKIWIGFILLLLFSCVSKKKEHEEFFPVLSFIKSQVAKVDTSFYPIIKITWTDSVHTDTQYVKREEFRQLSKDFLEIPDLTEKKYQSIYTEEKFFDKGLNRMIFTCKPGTNDTEIIQRQETQIAPDPSGDKVKSFYIDLNRTSKDSSVEKKMLWKVDESFQVATLIQKPGLPPATHIMKVVWNERSE